MTEPADQFSDRVRTGVRERAADVTAVHPWAPPETSAGRRNRRIAILAAAAVVLVIAGSVLAGALTHHSRTTTATPASSPSASAVPAGKQPVSALGVEIFVPASMTVDARCPQGDNVTTPLSDVFVQVPCPAPTAQPGVRVSIESTSAGPATATDCLAYASFGTEPACVSDRGTLQYPAIYVVRWRDVLVSAASPDEQAAVAILATAHLADPNRDGCAAARADLSPHPGPGTDATHLLAAGPTSIRVCWYVDNRLARSTVRTGTGANSLLTDLDGLAPKWPAPPSHPELPACEVTARSGAAVLAATYPGGITAEAAVPVTPCNGQRVATNGLTSRLDADADELARWVGLR